MYDDMHYDELTMKEYKKEAKRKNRRNVIIAVVITAVVTVFINNIVRDNFLIYLPSASADRNFINKFSAINHILKDKYLYDVDRDNMEEWALTTYIRALDEPYTNYYSKESFSSYESSLQDTYVGIGVVISPNDEGDIEVVASLEGSPAYEKGIMPGDLLLAVDGDYYSSTEMNDAVSRIKSGRKGTDVTLTMKRGGGEPFDIVVTRGDISQESVKTEMLDNNIGYVRITAFNTSGKNSSQNTYTEFKEKVTELQNSGMEKMIIDLRDNPGGALDVVCNIADMIVPEGTITYMEYKNGRRETYKSDADEMDIPMVVLINENSASASEVLTGCLKDYKKAVIVGKTSYGKGVVQTVYPFWDGSGLSVTVANYYSPSGVCIHGTGITPDIEVDMPEQYKDAYASRVPREEDTQLAKAIETLNQ